MIRTKLRKQLKMDGSKQGEIKNYSNAYKAIYSTSDLGTMSNDGYIKLIGRSKEMIIRGGENVAPKEIEELLHQHPLVYEAFVSTKHMI